MSQLRRVVLLLACMPAFVGQETAPATQPPIAKTWVGRYQEIEDYLRTAECIKMEQFRPANAVRCTLPVGGPVARMAWRPGPPRVDRGFRVSYKAEIATYELDKLLTLDMVPPSVERQLERNSGAAQQWVENVFPVKADELPTEAHRDQWDNQLTRMAMFDNLIGNRDRNLGNMIRDASWNLILLDHARAFHAASDLSNRTHRFDKEFWARIESLTRKQLDDVLGPWLEENEINAVLQRREKMRAEFKMLP